MDTYEQEKKNQKQHTTLWKRLLIERGIYVRVQNRAKKASIILFLALEWTGIN